MPNRPPRVAVLVKMGSRYHRDLYLGVARYARLPNRPFDVVFVQHDDLRYMRRSPDGIIAASATPLELNRLLALKLPTVHCGGRFEAPGVPTVNVDDLASGRLAAEHLLNCGFGHFGFFGQPKGLTYQRRRDGFIEALRAAGQHCHVHLRIPRKALQRPPAPEQRTIQRWLASLPRPVGILCSGDWDAWDVYDACDALGLRIRDEVGVMGIDNEYIYCESLVPPLSSVERRPERVGYEAATVMTRLLRGERGPSAPVLIPPFGVIKRGSTDVFVGSNPHVATVVRYIRDHPDQNLRVQELSSLVPMSRRVLERCFREHLGRSMLEEIHRTRINHLKQVLVSTDLSVEEIAARCGFANVSHMTALFHSHTGTTPSAYRKQFFDRRKKGSSITGE